MAKNWVSSPLGLYILQNLHQKQLGKHFKEFDRVIKVLKHKKEFIIKNKLFHLASHTKNFLSEINNKFDLEKETCTSSKELFDAGKKWVNQYTNFEQFKPDKYSTSDAKGLLTNICMYKGRWESPMVNVHNSFSYTEDIKYEVRILVVGTCDDDVSFAIVVPNETDVFCHLVRKLHEDGLSVALANIQPAFTATCKQTLPTFHFNSNNDLQEDKVTQHGCVTVNQTGIDIKVLTCLVAKGNDKIDLNLPKISNDCFSFAVICKDVPIFTGQVIALE